jgi:hypothetical protein
MAPRRVLENSKLKDLKIKRLKAVRTVFDKPPPAPPLEKEGMMTWDGQ